MAGLDCDSDEIDWRYKDTEGYLKQIEKLGLSQNKDSYEAIFDLLLEEENAVGMVDFYGTEEDVIKWMK